MSILDVLHAQILRDIDRKERERIADNIERRLAMTVMQPASDTGKECANVASGQDSKV